MPLQLLRELASQTLPAVFADPSDIAKLVKLRQLGLIIVLLPMDHEDVARVLLITAEGWRTLRKLSRLPDLRMDNAVKIER
ncbi:MAG: hypothetical protein DI587_33015 [Variovorax paradoxus]|nr:MAG: hypothetical protein DI583_33015 [Variovorax paradoxus]PZQ02216.1 MAG: hypothetical protein DI587_33015 [Variovorax paradoxus]